MHLRKRAVAAVFVATSAFIALAPQAFAAPMPWETGKTPVTTHNTTLRPAGHHDTVTVLCGPPCYQ